MASDEAIRMAIKSLIAAGYAGDMTAERVKTWRWALGEDVNDEQLGTAVQRVILEYTNPFLPPVALIREMAGANRTTVDVDGTLRQIERMGTYSESGHWSPPNATRVRERFGPAIGDAYADVGGARLYAYEETSRVIAQRDFSVALKAAIHAHGRAALRAPEPAPALAAPVKQLVSSTAAALRRPMAARELAPESE